MFLNGSFLGLHGNEGSGRELLISLINHLLASYGHDHSLTSLVNKTRIHILPLANPDGAEKAMPGNCDADLGKLNANGIDLGLQFQGNEHEFAQASIAKL